MSITSTEAIEAIQALRVQWAPHFNAGKISELGELFYAPDAFALPGDQDVVRGRANITALMQQVRDSGDVRFDLDIIEIAASVDIGYVVGTYVFTDASGTQSRGLTHE